MQHFCSLLKGSHWFDQNLIFFSLHLCFLLAGPGCSSLGVGAFSENGPFRPNGQVLLRNEYSWNRGIKGHKNFFSSFFLTY